MSAPIVSIVMPVRDAEGTLETALASIGAQTLRDWELVAVDDGSRDRSLARLRAEAARDPRVRVISLPPAGIVDALNVGLRAARAPLVARMDADDECAPTRLEAQVRWAQRSPGVAAIGSLVECFAETRVPDGMRHYEAWLNALVDPDDIAREIFVESPLAHPSVMVRRDLVLELGGYVDGPFPEDYELWLRLHAAGWALGKVPEVLLRWRDSDGRLTRTDPRYSSDAFRRLKARYLVKTFLAGQGQVQVWGAGPDGKSWRRALGEQGVRVVRYFDVDPRKIGGRVGREVPVLHWREVAAHRGTPLLCAVGVKGARARIRAALAQLGFREGDDHLFVQ